MKIARAVSGLVLCSLLGSAVVPAWAQQSSRSTEPEGAAATSHHDRRTVARNVRLSGTVRILRVSPPAAGVKLLEEVFQRVRSAPQVAMAKNLKVQQEEQQQTHILTRQGPTDYTLAIRPKQSGKIAMLPSPTLQLMPPSPVMRPSGSPPVIASGGAGGNMDIFSGSANAPLSMSGATPVSSNEPPPPPGNVPEQWMGNRQFPIVAGLPQTSKGLWESSVGAYHDAPKSMPQAVNSYAAHAATSPAAAQPVVPLGTAIGRLAATAKQIDEVQQHYVHFAKPATKLETASFDSKVADGVNAGDAANYGVGLPPVNAIKHAASRAADGHCRRKSSIEKDKLASLSRESLDDELAKASSANEVFRSVATGGAVNGKRIAMNSADIALLPPNVVTGIPLIHLGIPESQASAALSSVGSMRQEKVNKWSVWSWQRTPGITQTALQLYMRNGLLDAMRIFDSSLIARDFGVTLGDDLSKVKEKFGEPAFILQEPGGSGQNYIYPISQVGFQLARPSADQTPRVVSVLIFNVK